MSEPKQKEQKLEQVQCILPVLDRMTLPKIRSHGSNSIIVFGSYNHQEVTVKLTAASDAEDNHLEVERKIYMQMETLKLYTPHLAYGIQVGVCNAKEVLKLHKKIKQQWETICKEKFAEKYVDYYAEHPKDDPDESDDPFFTYLYNEHFCDKMHYVIMPKLFDKPLKEFMDKEYKFLTQPHISQATSLEDFDFIIAIQIAQTLCAAKLRRFMHNDLHLGNIFIEYFGEHGTTISYLYPFRFTLHTRFKITIFDFDLSSMEGIEENTTLSNKWCSHIGLCNQYNEWFDWDTFLNYYLVNAEPKRKLSDPMFLRTIRGGAYGEYDPSYGYKIGERAYFGRACTCNVNGNKDKRQPCATCTLDQTIKVKCTPIEFLELYVKNSNKPFIKVF